MVDSQPVQSAVAWVSLPKEFVVDRIVRARWLGALPKNCHLLPSAAIVEPQNRYARFNRFISTLPLEGIPASRGPGLRTASGAERSLGVQNTLSHSSQTRRPFKNIVK
jgi:hypothetical protein